MEDHVALGIMDALNEIGKDYNISIHWIKAHVGNKGNEIADQAAKTGCKLEQKCEENKGHCERTNVCTGCRALIVRLSFSRSF